MFQRKHKKYRLLADADLIQLYKVSKDKIVYTILYERYGHLVMGTCMKYLKDEYEAEDLTSKIFEELSDKIVKYDIDNFKSWLYRLTKNECLMFFRKQKAQVLNQRQIEMLSENEIDNEEKEYQLTLLEKSIVKLKAEQQECIRLFYLEDKSYQQVSDLLQMDIKQVKSAIQNGKRNLKIILIQNDEFKS